MLNADETALLYIDKTFDDSVPRKKIFYGGYVLTFPDGELYVSAAMGKVTVQDYNAIHEEYKLVDPTFLMPFERCDIK